MPDILTIINTVIHKYLAVRNPIAFDLIHTILYYDARTTYPEGIMHRVVVEVAEPLRAEYYN